MIEEAVLDLILVNHVKADGRALERMWLAAGSCRNGAIFRHSCM